MRAKSIVLLLLLPILEIGCADSKREAVEKHLSARDKVVEVQTEIRELPLGDLLISPMCRIYLFADFLLLADHNAYQEQLHLFDATSFMPLISFAPLGEAPRELITLGNVAYDAPANMLLVTDHGKQAILAYQIDSLLSDSLYTPWVKKRLTNEQFFDQYSLLNDTLAIGRIIKPTGKSGFTESMGAWNLNTGVVTPFENKLANEMEKDRISFSVSPSRGIYVTASSRSDLLKICNLDGSVRFAIYGPDWNSAHDTPISCYRQVAFCGNRIMALYSGKGYYDKDSATTSLFHVYDLEGNYLKTVDCGVGVVSYCYDEKNHRLLLNLDDEPQWRYLNLADVLD